MTINYSLDLNATWQSCTTFGKIFYFWLYVVGFAVLTVTSLILLGLTEFGGNVGLMTFEDESEENETTD